MAEVTGPADKWAFFISLEFQDIRFNLKPLLGLNFRSRILSRQFGFKFKLALQIKVEGLAEFDLRSELKLD